MIIEYTQKKGENVLSKGIQKNTLDLILEHLGKHGGQWMNGNEIAEVTGLTSVTVRRYMNYLIETKIVIGEMNYETGGRPCMLYRLVSEKGQG